MNKHANHSAYARFFEDAKEVLAADPTAPAPLRTIAERYLEAIIIAYHPVTNPACMVHSRGTPCALVLIEISATHNYCRAAGHSLC
eukprot:COSAG01_NODE_16718_length_1211_cov_1.592626_2_plen_85_part_01